jgi:hypothetical protein
MRDLKPMEWSTASTAMVVNAHQMSPPKTVLLLPAYRAFKENIRDVILLEQLPTLIFLTGRRFQKAETNAYLHLIQKPFPENEEENPSAEDLENTITAFLKVDPTFAGSIPMSSHGSSHQTFMHLKPFQTVLMQLMSLQLVAVWTIFETLAGDLWESALNAHPNILASLSGSMTANDKNAERPDPKHRPPRTQKQQTRTLSLSTLQFHRFDISEKMGSVLLDEEAASFLRLSNIRDAYVRAFSENHIDIRDAIYDHSLDALSICRNVIVHKAGICDQETIDRLYPEVQKLLPEIRLKHRLELDGQILGAILTPAIEACCKLIRAVDAWIVHHPDKPESAPP